MTERPQPLDPQQCPLCGKANQCAMELAKEADIKSDVAQPPCWCTQVNFSPGLLARVPVASQGLACVCAVCARSASSSHSSNPTH